jgi:hypothetical protein
MAMMQARGFLLRLALLGPLAAAGCSQNPKPSLVPAQTVDMDAHVLKKFEQEIQEYVQARKKLTKDVMVTARSSPEELAAYQRNLTEATVRHRRGEKQGNIFKPEVEAAIRRILAREFSGPEGRALIKAVKQGNPAVEGNPSPRDPTKEAKQPVVVAVNAVYNDAAPFSSVPPRLLQNLPLLPEEVRYRFVGRALILRDTEANVILDFIKDVIPDRSIPR